MKILWFSVDKYDKIHSKIFWDIIDLSLLTASKIGYRLVLILAFLVGKVIIFLVLRLEVKIKTVYKGSMLDIIDSETSVVTSRIPLSVQK